jgi:hypothetical protein
MSASKQQGECENRHMKRAFDWRGWGAWRRVLSWRPHGAAAQQALAQTKITPEQARQLFALVDELIKFSSDETGLPIKSTVKRRSPPALPSKATSREVQEDESAKRMQRDEIVLKKFGLLDRDFASSPFCWRCSRSRSKPTTTPRPRP